MSFGITVSHHSRGQGVGQQLLTHLFKLCKNELGITRIELEVPADNTGAQKLYVRNGFVAEGVKKSAAYGNGAYFDVIVMAKCLGVGHE
ncbi:GNAT family N-acetyltransferase [Veronia nyctiphanis]|uniref:GNAT family N-acetyltransferase n=1 Tax=Veronia nyctiphanis TaxID=1278244 RepID=UPI00137610F8|nr:GNAT family N-acetyltransferase [Veronia nyctiphanis]